MLCRICLTDITPLIGIFSEDGMKHQLADKIRICLHLQIEKDDCFPHKVCCKCFMSLNEFFSFWKKARESYSLLHKLQKDVTSKQSVSWPSADIKNENIDSTPDLLDMIDMETIGQRQTTDILKQSGNCDDINNYTGKTESTFTLLPADTNYTENFPSNMSSNDTVPRYLQDCDAVYSRSTMQPTHGTKTWKHFSGKLPAQQQPQTKVNKNDLDSKPNQFISKHFSFGRPSMTYGISKEVQENSTNSWEVQPVKSESTLHMAEKEKQQENLSNPFSSSMECSNSKDANSSFGQKPHNSGSQPIFSSNDEYSLPNIPLSLFSSSNDKKQTSMQSKISVKTKDDENPLKLSPIIGTSKVNSFSQKTKDVEMTPRSKVMKMLNRDIW